MGAPKFVFTEGFNNKGECLWKNIMLKREKQYIQLHTQVEIIM